MNMSDIGRDAFIIYLKDLRDLETSKQFLSNTYNEKHSEYRRTRSSLLEENKVDSEKKRGIGCMTAVIAYIAGALIIYLVVAIFAGAIGSNVGDVASLASQIPSLIFFAVVCLVIGYFLSKAFKSRNADRKHNQRDDERLKKNREYIAEELDPVWRADEKQLQDAYAQTCALLEENYSINLIPAQFRNLASIQYIHDFMSTSNLSFEQAVYQAQIDGGIRLIESKLDVIIQQNEEQIRQLYAIRENTDIMVKQQQAILMAQVATAYYTRQCALHEKSIDRVCQDHYLVMHGLRLP